MSESRFVTAIRSIQNPPKEPISSHSTPDQPQVNPNAIRNQADLIVGDNIHHQVFGSGVIVKVGEERIHIRFAMEEKALSTRTCLELGLLERANPVKKS